MVALPPSPPRQEMAELPQVSPFKGLEGQGTEINRVALRNFKGHADLTLDMGRITVLIGPTGSGKSTVLQALNLLRSALGSGGPYLQGGDAYGHGQFADIVTGRDERQQVSIMVDGRKRVGVGGKHAVDTKFSCRLTLGRPPHSPKLDATVDAKCGPHPGKAVTMRAEYSGNAGEAVVSDTGASDGGAVAAQADGKLAPHIQAKLAECPAADAFNAMLRGGEYFRALLEDLWHVPFSRVSTHGELQLECNECMMSKNHPQAAASPLRGVSDNNFAQKKISSMIKEVVLKQVAIRAVPVKKGEKSMLKLGFIEKDSCNAIVRNGSGFSQLVVMFAILAYAPRGSVVTIEEPEIHLDPAAQARLMEIMLRQVVEEGKQIVFTTHSDHLLYPLLACVKKKDVPLVSGDVTMHYFDTNESGVVGSVERLAINDHGQIRGGLKGFWDADMKAMRAVLG